MDAYVEVLFERLKSVDVSDLELLLPSGKHVRSKLKVLEQTISKILPALPVAVRQMEKNREARVFMEEVTKLAYELEKLLSDLLQLEALLARDRLRPPPTFSAKLSRCLSFFNTSRSLLTSVTLLKRILIINVEFNRLLADSSSCFSAEQQPAGHDDDADIFGRGEDLRKVMDFLLPSDGLEQISVSILTIVGSAGIGKTTLARRAYHDHLSVSSFDVRAWVLVPENLEVRRITRDVLENLGIKISRSDHARDLAALQAQLREYLSNKKFLLVLDHMGEIESEAWDEFMMPFDSASPGSRIIITTNTEANTTPFLVGSNTSTLKLERLADEDCWSLLASVAFPGRDPDEYSHLVSVGIEMVQMWQGQPLATKVLGRILKDEIDKSKWEDVLKKGLYDDISSWDSLFMSYDGLPARLKLCFSYFSIFPKDYKVLKETLIQLWIAEGFVEEHNRGTTALESVAEKYFLDLQSMSFFLDSNEGEGISMRPLVSQLGHLVSGQAYYHLKDNHDDELKDNHNTHNSSVRKHTPANVRHVSCIYDAYMKFEALLHYKELRTLLFVCSPASNRAIHSNQALPQDLFINFPKLTTLSLSGLPIQNLSDSIENLKELRFLDLSNTLIEKLPVSISTRDKLLTLKLNTCVYLAELPSMENLINLRHLDISGSRNIKSMARGMEMLTNLQSLSNFIVRDVNESLIQELRDLVHLSGKLSISGLQNVANSLDAKEANLASKIFLRELVLEWSSKFSERRDENVETEVLDYLKACSNLEILSIIYYGGTRFPEWISFSHKLTRVKLSNCRKCNSLPLLGQLPLLKALLVEGMDEVISIGTEFCVDVSQGSLFPSLEILEFKNMPSWEEWSFNLEGFNGFPRLKLLKIESCPKLKQFKVLMEALELLTINECQELIAFSLENFPRLRELDIQNCSHLKEMPHSFPSLIKLRIWGCQELISLSNIQPTGDISEEKFPCLLELDIQNCTSLRELPRIFPLLGKLTIRNCKKLIKLSAFPKLHDLILEECDELMLGNEVEVSSLVSMVIYKLPNFSYPRARLLQCLSSLINLEISRCENLVALSEKTEFGSGAVHSLERLVIDGCPKLKQLPDLFSCFSSLKELIVVGCVSLECFPEMRLPPVLKRLVIEKCKHFKSLPPTIFDSQDVGLEYLEIYGCPSLVSFSQVKLPPTLRLLSLWDCTNLNSLPEGLNQQNTSLNSLRIWDCHSIEEFPLKGLPCYIRSLSVMNCGNLKPLSEWGLDELECLSNFSFGGCDQLVDLNGIRLPNSVCFLLLKGLLRLESLSELLQNLDSLDVLTIRDCPKLEMLTEKKLPKSLSCLYVSNCPMLRQRCKSTDGEDWSKIEHIPLIDFDFQYVKGNRIN